MNNRWALTYRTLFVTAPRRLILIFSLLSRAPLGSAAEKNGKINNNHAKFCVCVVPRSHFSRSDYLTFYFVFTELRRRKNERRKIDMLLARSVQCKRAQGKIDFSAMSTEYKKFLYNSHWTDPSKMFHFSLFNSLLVFLLPKFEWQIRARFT